jgi:TonB-linked SusC/RagA family outer membrane protein
MNVFTNKNLVQRRLIVVILLLFAFHAYGRAQSFQLSGIVSDASDGSPLPGVTVQTQSKVGTATDLDGHYALQVTKGDQVSFSYLGMITQTVKIDNQRTIDIALENDLQALDEVVVVGYGVQKKSDVTGALVSVSAKQLTDRPVSNMLEALSGKAAGVDITGNARPGELGSIYIRGVRSITASSDPLYVVNGIPLVGRENINVLNTADIKSLEVLKDASATAIYGSRGANGVILITTHQGEAGKFDVKYDGSLTVSNLVDSRDWMTTSEFIDYQRWANYYANKDNMQRGDQPTLLNDQKIFNNEPLTWENIKKGWESGTWDASKVATTPWADYVTQQGLQQNHTVSISGGTEKLNNYISIGYMSNEGTSKGQSFDRYTVNTNTVIKPFKWFEAGARMNGAWQVQQYGQDRTGAASNSGPSSIYESAMRLYPYAVPFDENGDRIIEPGGVSALKSVIGETDYTRNERQVLSVMANVYSQIQLPLKGLSYRVEFGPSLRYRRNGLYVDAQSAIRESGTNIARLSNQRDFAWTVNNIFNYNNTFGIHSVGVTLLQTSTYNEQVSDNINVTNVPYTPALWNDFGSIKRVYLDGSTAKSDIEGIGSSLEETQMASYMARVNYALMERYLLTASIRRDGASQLSVGHKWANFPSFSLGWRMEQEDFMKNIAAINQLKLRLGYGVVGNATGVDPYSQLSPILSANYPYGNSSERYVFVNDLMATATRVIMANKDLTWERTGQLNIGVDFSVVNNRISGALEYYTSTTNGLILNANIPSITGYLTTTANIGKTRNNGVEFTLNTLNVNLRDFTWETSLTAAYQKEKIVELSNGKEDEIVATNATDSRLIGYPVNVYYDYKAAGIWRLEDAAEMEKFNNPTNPDGSPRDHNDFKVGQTRIVDQDGDYYIDANHDKVVIGQRNPTWVGSFNNTFNYKGIELMVQLYGRFGYWTDGGNVALGGKYTARKVNYYTEANTTGTYQHPEYTSNGSDVDSYSGALAYSKASFINIRNISLGYNFPKKILTPLNSLKTLRVYVQAVNPGAIYQSVDYKNMDLNSPIWNRSFVFGVNVGF